MNNISKIAIIGASGFIGSALTKEALSRGLQVRALVSRPERLEATTQLEVVAVDVLDTAALIAALQGVDVVLSAFSGHAQTDVASYYQRGVASILAAVKAQTDIPRLLLVGGAASLEVPDGSMLLDSPNFPAEYRGTAEGAYAALQLLRAETALQWSYLSPAAEIFPGDKTGQFRLGGDQLLTDTNGKSRISTGDYAVAMLDELQQPKQLNRRFSVAY
ncbi:3-beta hydroxysteroid dehydrogenase [Rheinheimera sp. SA_1]|uniref:NAD(P)-dependent oxidoreductase n=1 Tax=Rheinheimera sp. SA_1 TaxID=1827365 RepID=UPI000800CC36|nr:NAD(P)H-binding protein [Rheinheimera sp. SA_1]OBP13142.1 3-beta hydroxysteroid dehydrogenase [Rheinheimera sp. SA_1]